MRRLSLLALVVGLAGVLPGPFALRATAAWHDASAPADIRAAFAREGIRLTPAEAEDIRDEVELALEEARRHGPGNSKVDFAAVEIASRLGLDTGPGSNSVRNVAAAIRRLHDGRGLSRRLPRRHSPTPRVEWNRYFDRTLELWRNGSFMQLVGQKGFHPVKISWEDIGRHQNSVWGDRISDVGIWVRRDEADPSSARLALSVRRDGNFRDKVLGLASASRDRNVIVSNQFAIVPVPARDMSGAWPEGVPPRAAFNFSIFPYGSTNFVITDVIEGSHEAIVGPGQHQLLYANIDGAKAPFTASRAEDRQDLLRLERELRARGMDVDVQRYYLIQVPLRRGAQARPSNMGTPPWSRGGPFWAVSAEEQELAAGAGVAAGVPGAPMAMADKAESANSEPRRRGGRDEGLARVAIGHGESEGAYDSGSGWRGARAEEPIRVTVVYFVTPVGEVTRRDMETFTAAFESWDGQAIWGGSFVTKETL
jgi:hypothetical protein